MLHFSLKGMTFLSSKLFNKTIYMNIKNSSSLSPLQSSLLSLRRSNIHINNLKDCGKRITTLINHKKINEKHLLNIANSSKLSSSLPLLRINNSGIGLLKRNFSANSRLKKWKNTRPKHKGQSFKTRQAVAKRFLVTGKGKLKHAHSGRRHNTGHKSRNRVKSKLAKMNILHGTKMARNIHQMILGR